jgi:hypothetical protein
MNGSVSMQVDEKIVKEVVQQQITAAIGIELMKVNTTIIDGIVNGVLNQSVDSDGKVSTYSSATTFLVWLVRKSIRESATEAVRQYVDGQKDTMVKSIIKALKANPDSMAKALVNSFSESLKSWRFIIKLEGEK